QAPKSRANTCAHHDQCKGRRKSKTLHRSYLATSVTWTAAGPRPIRTDPSLNSSAQGGLTPFFRIIPKISLPAECSARDDSALRSNQRRARCADETLSAWALEFRLPSPPLGQQRVDLKPRRSAATT